MAEQVKERGILFNAEMVRAILAGRKTVTRRPLKGTVPSWAETVTENAVNPGEFLAWQFAGDSTRNEAVARSVFGVPGDLLVPLVTIPGVPDTYAEGADGVSQCAIQGISQGGLSIESEVTEQDSRWQNGLWLRVESVRVERVQACDEAEAELEGFNHPGLQGIAALPSRLRFRQAWDVLYAEDGLGWDANPWVWRCEFSVIEKEADRG